jgi:hypothetical protein
VEEYPRDPEAWQGVILVERQRRRTRALGWLSGEARARNLAANAIPWEIDVPARGVGSCQVWVLEYHG